MNDETQFTAEHKHSNSGPVPPRTCYFHHLQPADLTQERHFASLLLCASFATPRFLVPEDLSTLLSGKFTPERQEPLSLASD